MRFVPFAVLSSGLRNDRKYEQKERPCSWELPTSAGSCAVGSTSAASAETQLEESQRKASIQSELQLVATPLVDVVKNGTHEIVECRS